MLTLQVSTEYMNTLLAEAADVPTITMCVCVSVRACVRVCVRACVCVCVRACVSACQRACASARFKASSRLQAQIYVYAKLIGEIVLSQQTDLISLTQNCLPFLQSQK